MAPVCLYMVMLFLLQLIQLSSQLSKNISTIKIFQISYIYNENRTTFATFSLVTSPTLVPSEQHISDSPAADTCTPRVPIFRLGASPSNKNNNNEAEDSCYTRARLVLPQIAQTDSPNR